jgi:hypothetical protein
MQNKQSEVPEVLATKTAAENELEYYKAMMSDSEEKPKDFVQESRWVFHIVAGNKDWVPTAPELGQIVQAFMDVNQEPGNFIVTRDGIEIKQYRILTTKKTVQLEQDIISCAVAYVESYAEDAPTSWKFLHNLQDVVQKYLGRGGTATTQISRSHTCL